MNNFLDFLVFIGALYKLAVTIVVGAGIFIIIAFIFSILVSLVEWVF